MNQVSKAFNPKNKRSVKNLNEVLGYILKTKIYSNEKEHTSINGKTYNALSRTTRLTITKPEAITDTAIARINELYIKEKYREKKNITYLQSSLAKLNEKELIKASIASAEIKGGKIGTTTTQAIKNFQKKYKLSQTGRMNPETDEKLESVMASVNGKKPQKKKLMKASKEVVVRRVVNKIKINSSGEHVKNLQLVLRFLKYQITDQEYKSMKYGTSTKKAVDKFQSIYGLPVTGTVDKATAKAINKQFNKAFPGKMIDRTVCVKGSARDSYWSGIAGAKIQVYTVGLGGKEELVGEGISKTNGFYHVSFDSPVDPNEQALHLIVKITKGKELFNKHFYKVKKVLWANYTEGEESYKGDSEYLSITKVLYPILQKNDSTIADLRISETQDDIALLSQELGIDAKKLMMIVLANRVGLEVSGFSGSIFYAFMRMNAIPEVTDILFPDTGSEWDYWIKEKVEDVILACIFLDRDNQRQILEAALSQNYIPRRFKKDLEKTLDGIINFAPKYALNSPSLEGELSLKDILDLSMNTSLKRKYTDVSKCFVKNSGFTKDFFEGLKTDAKLPDTLIKDIQENVDIAMITGSQSTVMTPMKALVKGTKTLRDLAKLDEKDWIAFFKKNRITRLNSPIEGVDSLNDYAIFIDDQLERLYPDVSLLAGIESNKTLKNVKAISTFMDKNQDFALYSEDIDRYFKDNNTLSNEGKEELKVLQRLHRISPKAKVAKAMADAGLFDSLKIYSKGKEAFITQMKKKGISENDAKQAYTNAETQYAGALSSLMRYRSEFHAADPAAVANLKYDRNELEKYKNDLPNLDALFGSTDYIDSEACSSLYSPAAYLSDMLRFLSEKDAISPRYSVLDILLQRRPDIENIKLNCDNSFKEMPYIDIVNEVLENALKPSDYKYQSTLTMRELSAMPEHINEGAYDVLKEAKYPMCGSFNLYQEESRLYLENLKVPRYKLIETLTSNKTETASEFFGISSQELKLILPSRASASNSTYQKYWGLDITQSSVNVFLFLEKTKLSYSDLLDLLQVKFANYDGSTIENRESDDIEKQTLNKMSPFKYDKIHRFLRLWRHTDWEMWELDLLIRNEKIGNGKLDASCLVNLMAFRRLQDDLDLSVEECLVLFGPINTEVRVDEKHKILQPLYSRLFQNVTFPSQADTVFNPESLSGTLSDERARIISNLAITDKVFDQLLPQDDQLTLENLSFIYRYVLLADGLDISVDQLQKVIDITNKVDIFASLKEVLDFIDKFKSISLSRFDFDTLKYIVSQGDQTLLTEEKITDAIESLRASLLELDNDLFKSKEPAKETLEKHLRKVPTFESDEDLTKALNLIEGIWDEEESKRTDFISTYMGGFISDANNPADTLTISDALTENQLLTRYKFVSNHLYQYLNQRIVPELLADFFSLSLDKINILLDQVKVNKKALRAYFSDERLTVINKVGVYKYATDPGLFPMLYKAYTLLNKVALLVEGLNLSTYELQWFMDSYKSIQGININSLMNSTPSKTNNFSGWLNMYKLVTFKDQYSEEDDETFYSILDMGSDPSAPLEDLIQALSSFTGWTEKNLEDLHKHLKLKHGAIGSSYASAYTYEILSKAISLANTSGADIERLLKWSNRLIGKEKECDKDIKLFVKSKYDMDGWLKHSKDIQDTLRERKRSALTAYLIEHSLRTEDKYIGDIINPKYFTSAEDLCYYFLLDVEMNACQITSRIIQANNSIQFFVQRCFLGRENHYVYIPKKDSDQVNTWTQWKWMKNYRVWEANRKVFFYPENWIEPSLRDDKTPFFLEMEQEILQGEINHSNVENAFLSYLNKVDDVSKLQIISVYNDMNIDSNIMYVVGRTNGIPATYYYRSYDIWGGMWSPWQEIPVDIEGDHVMPVVYNRKLHLFWLMFSEKPIKVEKSPGIKATGTQNGIEVKSRDNPNPAKQLEIQLAWTVNTNQGWTSKVISSEKLIHPWERPTKSYHLRPRYKDIDNTLWIDLFISTSKEFNQSKFFDQFKQTNVLFTGNPHNETYQPWHSSSFAFDGDVVSVNLRPLMGYYGKYSSDLGRRKLSNSYRFVHDYFGEAGRAIDPLEYEDTTQQLKLPLGMHYDHNTLKNNIKDNVQGGNLYINDASNRTKHLLRKAKRPFRAVIPYRRYGNTPLIYQDNTRAFFIKPKWHKFTLSDRTEYRYYRYHFYPLYHPHTSLFIRELNRSGLDGLLTRRIQVDPLSYFPSNRKQFNFNDEYSPTGQTIVDESAKTDCVDFSFGGAYSIYNWETFFHAPILIADRLSQNQKFEEAMRWYHYVFDPTNIEDLPTPQRYWVTKPFYELSNEDYREQRITNLIKQIDQYVEEVAQWKNNPFKPHLIARYRPVAYQRNVVMKYIDNLLAWGDQLFRQDTLESVNQASLMYLLSKELLGDKPVRIPGFKRDHKSYKELNQEGSIDILGNSKTEVIVENMTGGPSQALPNPGFSEPLPIIEMGYFSIPVNDKLLSYWDFVDDRLTKIRNCQNIDGIKRSLSLLAPPIDPSQMVKAAASGGGLDAALASYAIPNPNYRFKTLHGMAVKFTEEVKELGDKILKVLETKDAEEMALLSMTHEEKLQEAIIDVKLLQIEEATELLSDLEQSLEAFDKIEAFNNRDKNMYEEIADKLSKAAMGINKSLPHIVKAAKFFNLLPDVEAGAEGFGGSPRATAKTGGKNVGSSLESFFKSLKSMAEKMEKGAELAEKQGKKEVSELKKKLDKDLKKIEKSRMETKILAAKYKIATIEKEKDNQKLKIEQAKTEIEYFKNKYTNIELYSWMLGQISSLYFNAYQIAYDMAKRAEISYQYELAINESSYINFGHWDNLKKGLLSGERLLQDLYRLETAYHDKHKRELELTKYISLADLAPEQLMQLKASGSCILEIPEWMYDMDYPGHYMRRIKHVSVTVPCEKSEYTGINCTLSLHKSSVRTSNLASDSYQMTSIDDNRFIHEYGTIKSIATSHGQDDSGLFELSFKDERFLPFEGAGAISTWGIQMPKENNQFDFDTVKDIILKVQYTARDGGNNLRQAAHDYTKDILPNSGMNLISFKDDLGDLWQAFLESANQTEDQELSFTLKASDYPYFARKLSKLEVHTLTAMVMDKEMKKYQLAIKMPNADDYSNFTITPTKDQPFTVHATDEKPDGLGTWNVKLKADSANNFRSLEKGDIDDLLLIIGFTCK